MRHLFCVICALMVLALGSLTFAHGAMAMDPACKADAEKFCEGKAPGKALMMCMHDNKEKVSQGCQDVMKAKHAEMKEKMAEGREACGGDVDKFCADKKGQGPRAIITCLKGHEAELSPACKNHASQGPGHGAMMHSTHEGVVTDPQPAPPVGAGAAVASPAGK